jgi:signal transduction histidine kinase
MSQGRGERDTNASDLLASISHELRTPLTSVVGFAQVVQNKLDKAVRPAVDPSNASATRALAQIDRNLAIVIRECGRLTDLVNDVVELTKLNSGQVLWAFERVDPLDLFNHACAASSVLFDGNVAFGFDAPDSLPAVRADHDRLLHTLLGLISNAHKFTEEGIVSANASTADGFVEFSVTDTGPGIDAGHLETIFEPFGQVGDTLTDKPRGAGLGLPIARAVVDAHGGRIWAQSVVGRGTTFRIRVPVADGPRDADSR